MIKSETGSGKTLAYLIPIVQILQSLPTKIDRTSGVYCVILVPTRELCVQIEETIKKLLLPFFWIVPTVICGGQKRKAEKSRLRKGANIIISTPGRLLDHVLHTTSLSLKCVKLLVLDEPFVGLDPKAAHLLKGMMRELCGQGGAIFFSTHVLEVAEKLCDKVAIIKSGRLIRSGTMEEVKGDDSLEQVFLELEDEA